MITHILICQACARRFGWTPAEDYHGCPELCPDCGRALAAIHAEHAGADELDHAIGILLAVLDTRHGHSEETAP